MEPVNLPTEVIQYLYSFLPINDILALSCTSRHFHMAYVGRQLPILEEAVVNYYGPIRDLVKLVIANEPDTRSRARLLTSRNRAAAHAKRLIQVPEHPPLTLDIIRKIVPYGEVARKWVGVWPRIRWIKDSDNRRLLKYDEQIRLRRAIYRFWTYNSLFHHSPFHPTVVEDSPSSISTRPWSDDPRLTLLRTYPTLELVQLYEFSDAMHRLLEMELFPSASTVMERYPQDLSSKAIESLSWDDGHPHRKLILVLKKLRPRELLHLFEETSTKDQRMKYLRDEGGPLIDTPSTLQPAIEIVTRGRRFNWRERDVFGKEIGWGITDLPCKFEHYDWYKLSHDDNPDGTWPHALNDETNSAQSNDSGGDDSSDTS